VVHGLVSWKGWWRPVSAMVAGNDFVLPAIVKTKKKKK
jgi:hypothetical protein